MGVKFRTACPGRRAPILILLCALSSGAHATPNVSPQIFDEATLGELLDHLRELDADLRRGLDGSIIELQARLPRLWRELHLLEGRLQRALPAVRERLEAIERELRRPVPRPATQPDLIAV